MYVSKNMVEEWKNIRFRSEKRKGWKEGFAGDCRLSRIDGGRTGSISQGRLFEEETQVGIRGWDDIPAMNSFIG